MENYQFQIQYTLSQSVQSTHQSGNELLEQLQFMQNETLQFINIEESDEEIDITKQKQVKTQLFCRRTSIQESSDSSFKKNDIYPDQTQIKQQEQQIQQNKQPNAQQIKRSMKRSQTAFKKDFGTFAKQHGSKVFLKRANQAIINNFEQIRKQKSIITNNISQFGKQHLRTIQVKYFKTNLSKVLFIDKEMTAIEFINLFIIPQYLHQKSIHLKEGLIKIYLNTRITLQPINQKLQKINLKLMMIASEDLYNVQKALLKRKKIILLLEEPAAMKAIASQVEHSFSDYEDKTITIDYPVILSCKQVDIVVNLNCQPTFGIDLMTLKKTYELFPQYIILLIEDAQTGSNQQITCLNNSKLQNVFDSFNNGLKRKRSSKDYFLRLKYPCIHIGIDPLCLDTPINQLPIHWLVLEKKQIIEIETPNLMELSKKFSNFQQPYYHEDGFISYNQQDLQMKIDSIKYFTSLYSYQEFQVMQLEKKQQYQVLIGIDYFDIRIFYVNNQNNLFPHYSMFQYIKNYIVDMFKSHKKEEKIIKLKSIKKCSLDEKQNKFYFIYKNSVSILKQLCFIPEQSNDKRIQVQVNTQFFELYQKLDKLLGIRKNHQRINENLK